jgi:DNA-binding transcriptional LysR family regulator
MTVSLSATLAGDLGVDILSLLVFARVLDCGGISQAAAELELSRSAVSRRLAELESRLGVRLLARSTRRLAATEAGDALLLHCRRIAEEARAAADAVGGAEGAKGLLRVSLPPTLGKRLILPRLGGFLGRHPEVALQVLVTDLPFAEITRKVDIAVRIVQGAPEGFVSRRLRRVAWVPVASPAYVAARGAPATPAALAQHDALLFGALTHPAIWNFPREKVRVQGRVRANNLEALGLLAEQGLGVALLPDYAAAPALAAGRLVALLPGRPASLDGAGEVHAVYAPPTASAPRLRAFLAFLGECLAER